MAFWSRNTRKIAVLCSVCSGEMKSVRIVPAAASVSALSVYRCDDCGSQRTVEQNGTAQD